MDSLQAARKPADLVLLSSENTHSLQDCTSSCACHFLTRNHCKKSPTYPIMRGFDLS